MEWYASRPTVLVAAGGLITDESGAVLMVKPNYRDHWGLPGGVVDQDEPPHVACGREVEEEVGLVRPVGDLLAVSWAPPFGDRRKPMIYFLYDCGTVPAGAQITLQTSELDAYAFLPADEAETRTEPMVAGRLTAALRARTTGHAGYLVVTPV